MKRVVSILVAALLLLAAVPAFAAEGLQSGLYVSDSGKEVLYLDEAGVGVLDYYSIKEEEDFANGVLWTGNSLEIERSRVSFALNGDLLTFIFDNQVFSLRYTGPNADYALGDQGTANAGTYAAKSGEKLTLAADGRGVYADAAGEKAIFWGSLMPYWKDLEDISEGASFVLFDSYLSGLYFQDGGATLYSETGEEISLARTDAAPEPAPAAAGLKAGVYLDEAGNELLYLFDNGVGFYLYVVGEEFYANGILWTPDAMEIEREKVPFLLKDDTLVFTYANAVRMLSYEGVAETVALGDIDGTTYAGTYAAEDGRALTLTSDGRGVYTDASGEKDVYWGCFSIFFEGVNAQDSGCFIFFDSFVSNLTFEGDTAILITDQGEEVTLRRQGGKAAEPTGDGDLYYGYRMSSDGETLDLIPLLQSMGMDPKSISILFRPDGTGRFQLMEDDTIEFTWTQNTFTYDGESAELVWEGDHVLLNMDGEILEFVPAAEFEALLSGSGTGKTDQPQSNAPAGLVGSWTFTKAKAMGMEVPASMMGTTMSLVLNENGTAVLSTDNEVNDLEWYTNEEGAIVLTVAGTELFTMIYDGETLTLDTGAGVEMVFEKDA